MSVPLHDLHILVTRPKHQATNIQQKLQAAGAMVSCLPVIDIIPPQDTVIVQGLLQQTDKYDNVIFISHNAVVWALQLSGGVIREQLAACRVGAIGGKTATTLSASGINVDDVPEQGFNSEAFLTLPLMQSVYLEERKILIVRGEGGRELLARELECRGASVDYADVYRRVCPAPESALPLMKSLVQLPLDMIALTSCEGLQNLLRLLNRPQWLYKTPLLVGSERIAREAVSAGFKADLIVADDPGDDSMLKALLRWRGDKEA